MVKVLDSSVFSGASGRGSSSIGGSYSPVMNQSANILISGSVGTWQGSNIEVPMNFSDFEASGAKFVASAFVSSGTGEVGVRLKDIDSNSVIAGSEVTTTETSATLLKSNSFPLPSTDARVEVELRIASGTVSTQAELENASLFIEG